MLTLLQRYPRIARQEVFDCHLATTMQAKRFCRKFLCVDEVR